MEQDRTSGASEIMRQIIEQLTSQPENLLPRCRKILTTYPSMGSLWRLANTAFLKGKEASFTTMREAEAGVIRQGHRVLKEGVTVLTYSRSSTVKEMLVRNGHRVELVLCSESRPLYEGRQLARELSRADIPVTLTTDVGLLEDMRKADLVLVGADALVDGVVVNKVGTGAVMREAAAVGLPVYVAAATHKAFPFVFIKEEPGGEVWASPPSGVRIKNVYFGTVSASKITAFITEKGVGGTAPVFHGDIAPEIEDIKNHLEKRDGYRLVEGGEAAKTQH